MAEAKARYVAVIDDDRQLLDLFVSALSRAGLEARGFSDPQTALYSVIDDRPGTIVVDLHMPGMDGFDFMRRIQVSAPDVPVIMVTGTDGRYADVMSQMVSGMGAVDFLRKPVKMRTLVDSVRRALGPTEREPGKLRRLLRI